MRAFQFLTEAGYNPNGLAKQYGDKLLDVFFNSAAGPTNEDFNDFSDLYQIKRMYLIAFSGNNGFSGSSYSLSVDPITGERLPQTITGTQYIETHKPQILKRIVDMIASKDPTPKKEYSNWLVKQFATGKIKFEDLNRWDMLNSHYQGKIRRMIKPEHADINRFKTYRDFETVMSTQYDLDALLGKQKQEIQKGKVKEFYKDDQVRIVIPEDQEAACYYGQGTQWCTAATKGTNYFNSYNKRGPLYILLPTNSEYTGEKYQLHFGSESFMNEQDEPVRPDWILKERFNLFDLFAERYEFINNWIIMADENDGRITEIVTKIQEFAENAVNDALNTLESNDDFYNEEVFMYAADNGLLDDDGVIKWEKLPDEIQYINYRDEVRYWYKENMKLIRSFNSASIKQQEVENWEQQVNDEDDIILETFRSIPSLLSQYISDNIRGSVAANLAEWIDGNIQVLGQGYSREVKNKNSDDLQVEL